MCYSDRISSRAPLDIGVEQIPNRLTTTFTILTMRYSEIVFLIQKLFHISTKSNAETICTKILYSVIIISMNIMF